MPLRHLYQAATLVFGLAAGACGGGAEPPAHPPKVEAVRPTVEQAPPPRAEEQQPSR